jgi:hypothetical protein
MKRTKTILAFDPGERTGWVLAEADLADPESFAVLDQGVWTVVEVMDGLPALVKRADVVVYETWRLYESHALAMIGNDMQPSQVVGMIRMAARKAKKPVKSQGAAIKNVAFATVPKWVIKHLAKSSEKHDQDAILHAWYYVWNHANAN